MLVEHSTRAADCVIPAPFAAGGVLVGGWRRRSIDCIDCSEADANAWKPVPLALVHRSWRLADGSRQHGHFGRWQSQLSAKVESKLCSVGEVLRCDIFRR